jgi:hypothetical protein
LRGFAFVGQSMKTALLVDGGYLRASAKKSNKVYDTDFIENFSRGSIEVTEYLFRIIYYDAPLYRGNAHLAFLKTNYIYRAYIYRFSTRQSKP